MSSDLFRVSIAVAAIAVLIVGFLVLSSEDEEGTPSTQSTTASGSKPGGSTETQAKDERADTRAEGPAEEKQAPEVLTIVVKGGQPEGGVTELEYDNGDQVRFVVASDVDEGVHVHGYDIEQEVAAGGKTEFDFTADLDGIYEIELENSAVPIAELTVGK